MEDELFATLYQAVRQEATHRPRRKRVRYSDAVILLVAFWAILHDRPISWACRPDHWHQALPWEALPSPATMSRRLRTVSVQLLLEQVFCRLLSCAGLAAFCLCRRIDSKPLPVGGFSKDRDARRGYATGGTSKGYKLFCCWGKPPLVPEALTLAALDRSDQAGGIELVDRLDRLHQGAACGYLLADSTHDTNPLHAYVGAHGLQLLAPRKRPGTAPGHRDHSPHRLRSIALLEPPSLPTAAPAPTLGPQLYRQRGQIERDFGQLGNFGGGLQPLPNFVRRPRRVALWVIAKLIINGIRISKNHGLKV
jgi:hypothetical protein